MYFLNSLSVLPLVALITSVVAAPIVEEREALAATTCGSTYYTATQVNQAAQKACTYYSSGDAPGGYPHTYNNYEGFSFSVSGPYLEFPLLSSGVYTGGRLLLCPLFSMRCELTRNKDPPELTESSSTPPASSQVRSPTPVLVVTTSSAALEHHKRMALELEGLLYMGHQLGGN